MICRDIIVQRIAVVLFLLVLLIALAGIHVHSLADQSGLYDGGKTAYGNKKLNDFEEERTYRKDNVIILVKKLYAEEKLYWNFEITVENGNDMKKTVEGAICLYNMYIQPRECGAEECSVRMAVHPRSSQVKQFRCKGKVDMNSWAFLILKIHNY